MGDPENGGRFTVKRYHSAKTVSPPALVSKFQLLSFQNFSFYPTAPHEGPEMVVVGEWVASID